MADDRQYAEVRLPGSRRRTRILLAPAGVQVDKDIESFVKNLEVEADRTEEARKTWKSPRDDKES